MTDPELAVRNSGWGGRGYILPADSWEGAKKVKGSSGNFIPARLDWGGNTTIVPSVTTVLKAAAKPAIEQWVADQTAAYAVANVDELLRRTETQGWGFLRWYHKREPQPLEEGFDIRNYASGVLNDSAELGTQVHEWIEADVDPSCSFPEVDNLGDMFWEMQEEWEKFSAKHFIMPVRTECTVWNHQFGYAGTFDGLWNIDGEDWLLDIKTARSLWPDHMMQLAALMSGETYFTKQEDGTWVEDDFRPLVENVRYGFLHVRPNDVDTHGNPIPAFVRLEEASHLDLRFEQFKGYLAAKRVELAIKEIESAAQVESSTDRLA